MNSAKRRRLDESSSTLSKPFKSPMRVDVKKKLQSDNITEPNPNLPTPISKSTITTDPRHLASSSSPTKLPFSPGPSFPKLNIRRHQSFLSSPIGTQSTRTSTISAPIKRSSSSESRLILQKSHSAALVTLFNLRTALDTATQALKIESSPSDAELESLITKWTLASREAAEELFCGAKDRVNRMGGVGAWKERSRSTPWGGEDGGHDGNGDGDTYVGEDGEEVELTQEQKEMRDVVREEMVEEREKYGGDGEEGAEVEVVNDDESFTMDMMLKQLGIELDLIGYDKRAQRWI